jgi:hypothetical protein
VRAGNRIGDEGAKALAEALKTNETITTVELGVWVAVYRSGCAFNFHCASKGIKLAMKAPKHWLRR